jgi:hypothetical protein
MDDLSQAAESYQDEPVRNAHLEVVDLSAVAEETKDGYSNVVASRIEIVPVLLANGYDVTYEEFTGVHEVPPEIASLALDWFVG